jgi:sulfate permease, SulP family
MQSSPSLKVHRMTSGAAGYGLRRALPDVLSGLASGLLCIIFGISYGALAFSGPLSSHLSEGLAAGIVAAVVLNVAAALSGSLPWAVAHAQPTAAVVIALMGASISRSVVAPAEFMPSVLAMITLTCMVTGTFFFVLGTFRLGRLVRFVPYAVAGGFQAGIGWLMAVGSIKILTGTTVTLGSLGRLFDSTSAAHVMPAVILAIALLFTAQRTRHFSALLALLVASALLFYLVLAVTGVPTARAESHGWLMGPLTRGFYHPLHPDELILIRWQAVFAQVGGMATVMMVASTGLLLNVTRLEVTARHDLDVDRDLRALGIGNLISGIAGGLPGFHSTTASLATHRSGQGSRLIGMVAATTAVLALFWGAALIAAVPRLLIGGFLFFLGAQLITQWVIRGWSTMGRLDYAVLWTMLLVIGARGFLVGTVVGIILAMALFVISYSRVGVVKHELGGATYQSNVDRSLRQQHILQERGDALYILTLQGFLFFGTSTTLLERIRRRVDGAKQPPVRFIVLDCHLITGVDASLGLVFRQILQLMVDQGVSLALAGMPHAMERALQPDVAVGRAEATVQVFPDLDRAVEWCEDRILDKDGPQDGGRPMLAQLMDFFQAPDLAQSLISYFDRLSLPLGNVVVRQGKESDALFLVESGKLNVVLETTDGTHVHLRTVAAGALLGELGFYLGTPRTASVVAAEPSVLYRLTREAVDRMQLEDPAVAAAFGDFITRLLANRVVTANQTIAQLTS